MSKMIDNDELLKEALLHIEKLEYKIAATHEPIAVVGLGCRFPGGANSPELFWELLQQGFDASIDVPNSRWDKDKFYDPTPDIPGKIITQKSSFLTVPVDQFDANFFGISPREAEFLDPQQRLLLEVTWEALEDAGINPKNLKGTSSGVFIGISTHDYEDLIRDSSADEINPYYATGNMASTAAGRISFLLGLNGPCIAIDTACSSSLVALHQACNSLHLHESDIAIVGGVNLILSPTLSINFSQAHMLASDGHCKTFDKNADGYVRGEGCGVIILKRLSEALHDNDRILAVVRGSAVNQDGASSGLTVPNGPSQENVIKRALQQASLKPDDIDYIEAHGTGTALGDPIEINAIYNVFKNPNRKALTIGTVKTNIGHLEAAAGIAGVIKTILALQHEVIPRHLHFTERNPQIIDFNEIPAQLPLETLPWKKSDGHTRRAGVSGFAFSGTNAHVILEEAPIQDKAQLHASLPKTEFHRQAYWAPVLENKYSQLGKEVHPLLGVKFPEIANADQIIYEQLYNVENKSLLYLEDHKVYKHIVFPAAGYVELVLAALRYQEQDLFGSVGIKKIEITSPLSLEANTKLQVIVNDEVTIYSQQGNGNWRQHAKAYPQSENAMAAQKVDKAAIQLCCVNKFDSTELYQRLAKEGLEYGPAFQTIKEIYYNDNEILVSLTADIKDDRYQLYPAILDGALQSMAVILNQDGTVSLPVGFDSITVYQPAISNCYAYITMDKSAIQIFDDTGKVLAQIEGVHLQKATKSALQKALATESIESWLYEEHWQAYSLLAGEKVSSITYDVRDKKPELLLEFLQALILKNEPVKRLNIITENAYQGNLSQAIFNGFIKTAILEQPEFSIRQLDVDPGQNIQPLLEALDCDSSQESLFAYHENQWLVQRMIRYQSNNAGTLLLNKNATYLITGGLGGLGLILAQNLIEQGAGKIVLVSRRQPDDKILKMLNNKQTDVITYQADISDKTQVDKLIKDINTADSPLKGIFHLAGMIADAPLEKQTAENFKQVYAAKARGAWNLHEATEAKKITLDYFVLFSSIASLMGSMAQSNYATANSFLDGLAYYRQKQGLAAQSINWGPWAEAGIAKDLGSLHRRQGLIPLRNVMAIQALNYVLTQPTAQIGICNINWTTLSKQMSSIPSWLFDLVTTLPNENKLLKRLRETASDEREVVLREILTQEIKRVLGLPPTQEINEEAGFFEMGMDSLMALELKNRLQNLMGKTLPQTLSFDYPTLGKLSAYLNEDIGVTEVSAKTNEIVDSVSTHEPMAIIGMACRFPFGGNSLDTFWELLNNGENCVTSIPSERWDMMQYYDPEMAVPGKMYTQKGAFLKEDITAFDADFFKILPKEAMYMDPQQRLLLEVAWEAISDACIPANELRDKPVGFFLGEMNHDYAILLHQANKSSAYIGVGTAPSATAGRVSYTLGLQGPCLAIDTACSSSLVALNSAMQSLHEGECDMAIVAGVNLMVSPYIMVQMCQAKMLSPDGYCKTFDESANGYGRGEGCGVIILKPLSKALRDKDKIWAVVKGSAVNQDGASSGLTVPNGPAQEKVINRALAKANLTPDDIDYVEAHGTGTSLGDPIEVNALSHIFGKNQNNKREQPLIISSVKTYVGHLESAAGIAGIIKTVLSLQNEKIPKHLHLNKVNPKITDLAEIPAVIPTEKITWKKQDNHIRRAGISSFGFSGINAHVILEEAPKVDIIETPEAIKLKLMEKDHLLIISAKTDNALQAQMDQYVKFLETTSDKIEDICYTSQEYKTHFDKKILVIGKSKEELISKIQHKDFLARELSKNDYGYEEETKKYLGKVTLPFYPFQREQYWAFDLKPKAEKIQQQKIELPKDKEYEWKKVLAGMGKPAAIATNGAWLIFSDTKDIATELQNVLAENKTHSILIEYDKTWSAFQSDDFNISLKFNPNASEQSQEFYDYLKSKKIVGLISCIEMDDENEVKPVLQNIMEKLASELKVHAWSLFPQKAEVKEGLLSVADLDLNENQNRMLLNNDLLFTLVGIPKNITASKQIGKVVYSLIGKPSTSYLIIGRVQYELKRMVQESIIKTENKAEVVSETKTVSEGASLEKIRDIIISILGLQLSDQYDDKSFIEMGIDSLMIVEIRNQLEKKIKGLKLTPEIIYANPSINQLFQYISKGSSAVNDKKETEQGKELSTEQHEKMRKVILDVLGLPQSQDVDDKSFIEMGIDSLMVVELSKKLEKLVSEVKLTPEIIYAHPSINALIKYVDETLRQDKQKTDLICLKRNTVSPEKEPLFIVHGIDGGMQSFMHLGSHLNINRSVYGIQISDKLDDINSIISLEQRASYYIDCIKKVQAKGPYYLCAWSLGGATVFEMAAQLSKQGEKVAFLGLLDGVIPFSTEENKPLNKTPFYENAGIYLYIFDRKNHQQYESLKMKEYSSLDEAKLLEIVREKLFAATGLDKNVAEIKNEIVHMALLRNQFLKYHPAKIDCNAALFIPEKKLPQEQYERFFGPIVNWNDLLNNIKTYQVGGDHFTMLAQENNAVLLEKLAELLNEI
jgi:acyl transferase domain-containing protein/thioesterase domain-containing protein/acyl carrier protein